MPHLFKGQSPRQYRPSATRRASGLSPINEKSENAKKRWNVLRQSVKRYTQSLRNAKVVNAKLVKLANYLNEARKQINEKSQKQRNRLRKEAKAMNALGNENYLAADALVRKMHKRDIAKLASMRNKLVNEIMRNSTSTQARRNLYARGIEQGRYGTSEPNWQTWANKLWHMTERKQRTAKFFTPSS